jgi:hypothetical protein
MKENIKQFAIKNAAQTILNDIKDLVNRDLLALIKKEDDTK